jgi:hypothetical protein
LVSSNSSYIINTLFSSDWVKIAKELQGVNKMNLLVLLSIIYSPTQQLFLQILKKKDWSMAKRKRTNNDLQNITLKTNDRVTRTPLKIQGEVLTQLNPTFCPADLLRYLVTVYYLIRYLVTVYYLIRYLVTVYYLIRYLVTVYYLIRYGKFWLIRHFSPQNVYSLIKSYSQNVYR